MKKNLTKLFVLVAVLGISLPACKKSSSNKTTTTTYNMKVTINGTVETFSNCLVVDITANGLVQFDITGVNSSGSESIDLNVLADPASLKAGTTFQAATEFLEPNALSVQYSDTQNNDYGTINDDPSGSMTITSVTSTAITGTFTGAKLYTFPTSTGVVKYTFTSGTFTAEQPK